MRSIESGRGRRFAGFVAASLLVAAVYGLARGSSWAFADVFVGGVLLALLITLRPRGRGK